MSNSATKDIDAMALGCGFFEVFSRKQLCEVIYELERERERERSR